MISNLKLKADFVLSNNKIDICFYFNISGLHAACPMSKYCRVLLQYFKVY